MEASVSPLTPLGPGGETGPSQGEVLEAHLLATAVGFLSSPLVEKNWGSGWQFTPQMNSLYGPVGQSHPLSGPQFLHLWDGVIGVAQWIRILEAAPRDDDSLGLGSNIPGTDVKNKPTNHPDGFDAQPGFRAATLGCTSYSVRVDFALSIVRRMPELSEQNKPEVD